MTNVIDNSCMMYIHVLLPSYDAIVTKLFDPSLSQVVTIRIIHITIGMPLLSFHHYIRYIFSSKGLQIFWPTHLKFMLEIYLPMLTVVKVENRGCIFIFNTISNHENLKICLVNCIVNDGVYLVVISITHFGLFFHILFCHAKNYITHAKMFVNVLHLVSAFSS